MRRALVLQHMEHDTPGRFLDLFAEDGIVPETIALWRGEAIPALAAYDLLFVLGGPQDVWEEDKYLWLKAEKAAIREWVGARAKPYIGICLGHQLLAEAMGGAVGRAARSEIGVFEVATSAIGHKILAGLDGTHPVMQWHHAEVTKMPENATNLASSESTSVQAIVIDNHALGLQFHAEWTPQTLASWQFQPHMIAALEREWAPGGHGRLMREAYPPMPRMGAMTRRLYANLKHAAGLGRAA